MKRPFTLIETLVVLAILALVIGIVMPAVLRVPKRLVVEGAQTGLIAALRECAIRAVASGQTVQARLDSSGRSFQVRVVRSDTDALGESHLPKQGPDGNAPEGDGMLVTKQTSYPVPEGVKWELDNLEYAEDLPTITFHPDGSASGPELVFVVAERRFVLWVDRLTGRPEIRELTQ
jgi:type II secretory pathway pseudopilin PulG